MPERAWESPKTTDSGTGPIFEGKELKSDLIRYTKIIIGNIIFLPRFGTTYSCESQCKPCLFFKRTQILDLIRSKKA